MSKDSLEMNLKEAGDDVKKQVSKLSGQIRDFMERHPHECPLEVFAEDASGKAKKAVRQFEKNHKDELVQAKRHVTARPLTSVLLSLVVGFIAGRLSKR